MISHFVGDPCCGKTQCWCSTTEHTVSRSADFYGLETRHSHCKRNGAFALIQQMKESTKSMMKKISFAAVFCALAMFVAAPLAQATTITEVQAMIASLRTKTETVIITGKSADKDRAGLVGKLNEASLKVGQATFCHAIQRVTDQHRSADCTMQDHRQSHQASPLGRQTSRWVNTTRRRQSGRETMPRKDPVVSP